MTSQTTGAATAVAHDKRNLGLAAAFGDGWRCLCWSGRALLALLLIAAIVPTLLVGTLLMWSVTGLRQVVGV